MYAAKSKLWRFSASGDGVKVWHGSGLAGAIGTLFAIALISLITFATEAEAQADEIPPGAMPYLNKVHAAHRAHGRRDMLLPASAAVLDYAGALFDRGAADAALMVAAAVLEDGGIAGSEADVRALRLGALAVAGQAYAAAGDPVRATVVLTFLDGMRSEGGTLPTDHSGRPDLARAALAGEAANHADPEFTLREWDGAAQAFLQDLTARAQPRDDAFAAFLQAYSDGAPAKLEASGEALLHLLEPAETSRAWAILMIARSLSVGRDTPELGFGQDPDAAKHWLRRALDLPVPFLAALPVDSIGAANPVETLTLASITFRREVSFDIGLSLDLAARAVEIATLAGASRHPRYLGALEAHAAALEASGDAAGAVEAWSRVIAQYEAGDAEDPLNRGSARGLAAALAARAAVLGATPGDEAQAEADFVKALGIAERGGAGQADQRGEILVTLGDFYASQTREADALGTYRAAVEVADARGDEGPELAYLLARLGALEVQLGALSEAEARLARARLLAVRVLDATDPAQVWILESLAETFSARGAEVPPALAEALASAEARAVDSPSPLVAAGRAFGAGVDAVYSAYGARDFDAALRHGREALAVARSLGNPGWEVDALRLMAVLHLEREEYADALEMHRQAAALEGGGGDLDLAARQDSILSHLQTAILAIDSEDGPVPLELYDEAFRLAQQLSRARVGDEVSSANMRRVLGDQPVAASLRRLQDAQTRRDGLAEALLLRLTTGQTVGTARAELDVADMEIAALEAEVHGAFPDYAAHLGTTTASLTEAAAALAPNEAMVVFASRPQQSGDYSAQIGAALVVTTTTVSASPVHYEGGLSDLVQRLRCTSAVGDTGCAPVSDQGVRGKFSVLPEPEGATASRQFDYAAAHDAYVALMAPLPLDIENGGIDTLIVVPDASLVALPFHLMVTRPTPEATPFRDAPWLLRDIAVTVAPSVSSFVGLRRDAAGAENLQARTDRFLGMGDPLIGRQAQRPLAFDCATRAPRVMQVTSARGGTGRTEMLRALEELPDTECELAEIAAFFGDRSTILVHEHATEAELKALSRMGQLRDYSVISLATHGLIAGEIGSNQAGLVLTPPAQPGDEDDGLLTTAEIAALDLQADFVLLSACNTAAGEGPDDEGLTGLASAFFYAGARNLLVSHWPVYSDAAARLTTEMMRQLDARPELSRAQALRRAMLAVLDDPASGPRERHPSYWAPFAIVGEGGAPSSALPEGR